MKPIAFVGSALDDLRDFPVAARREAGHQLDRLQRGLDPDDWKPMVGIGPGVREIRVRDGVGALRVIYLATLPEATTMQHASTKKTQQTPQRDIERAAVWLRRIRKERG
jgi:phage-related protein